MHLTPHTWHLPGLQLKPTEDHHSGPHPMGSISQGMPGCVSDITQLLSLTVPALGTLLCQGPWLALAGPDVCSCPTTPHIPSSLVSTGCLVLVSNGRLCGSRVSAGPDQ